MNKKLKLLGLLGIVIVSGLLTGCNNSIMSDKPDFEVLDSKINYFVINNKKIYLTRNIKDFTLQFKGLGCKIRGGSN